MYAIRRSIAAFVIGALLFAPAAAVGASPHFHTLAAVLAAGNDADGSPIVNLGAPSDPDDAATKGYVDNLPQHLFVQTSEPDAAPGDLWIDPTPGPQPFATRKRNESDDGWLIGDVAAIDANTYSGWERRDDGTVLLFVGAIEIRIDPDGSIGVGPNLTLGADGSIDLMDGTLRVTPDYNVIFNGPSSDPAIPGALWNDAGTLKVSAG